MVNVFAHTGRLGQDPEMKYFDSGKIVTKFTMAVGFGETVSWFNYEAWDKAAENIGEYCRKGHQLSVGGYSVQEKWKDKETGENRSKVVFRVLNSTFESKKNKEEN